MHAHVKLRSCTRLNIWCALFGMMAIFKFPCVNWILLLLFCVGHFSSWLLPREGSFKRGLLDGNHTPYTRKYAPVKNFANGSYFELREKLISPILLSRYPTGSSELFTKWKISQSKFSPRTCIGEIGENFHMAKISAYTVSRWRASFGYFNSHTSGRVMWSTGLMVVLQLCGTLISWVLHTAVNLQHKKLTFYEFS